MRRTCYLLLLAFCLLLLASCDWRGDHYERLLAEAEEMNRNDSLFTAVKKSACKKLFNEDDSGILKQRLVDMESGGFMNNFSTH